MPSEPSEPSVKRAAQFEPDPLLVAIVDNAPFVAFGTACAAFVWGPEGARLTLGAMFLVLAALAFCARLVLRATPGRVKLVPIPEAQVPPVLVSAGRELEELGFRAMPTVEVAMSSVTVTMMPFVHGTEPAYATCVAVQGALSGIDFVSIAPDGEGGLTTTTIPSAGIAPARPRAFRQVLVDLDTRALWRAHQEAVAMLRTQGMELKSVTEASLDDDVQHSMEAQRRFLWEAPYRRALTAFARAVTGLSPHKRPLREQSVRL